MKKQSYCPVNQSLDVIGDKWTLLIIRDIMFHGKRHFNEFLTSEEKIAKNILSDRLKKLVNTVILVKVPDESHKQKNKYILDYSGIDLIPIMIELYLWAGWTNKTSESDFNLVLEMKNSKFRFQEQLKKTLTLEIKEAFKNNDDLFKKTMKKISPGIKTIAEITKGI